jgi:hypothetical protein
MRYTGWRTGEGDQRGGEWEPIKITHRNLAYIPNMKIGQVLSLGKNGQVLASGTNGQVLSLGKNGQVLSLGKNEQVLASGTNGQVLSLGKNRQVLASGTNGQVLGFGENGQVLSLGKNGQVNRILKTLAWEQETDKGKPDQCRLKVVRKLSGGANWTSTEERTKLAPPGETERKNIRWQK